MKIAKDNNLRVGFGLCYGMGNRQRRLEVCFHICGSNRLDRAAQRFLMIGERAMNYGLGVTTDHHHFIDKAEVIHHLQSTLLG